MSVARVASFTDNDVAENLNVACAWLSRRACTNATKFAALATATEQALASHYSRLLDECESEFTYSSNDALLAVLSAAQER